MLTHGWPVAIAFLSGPSSFCAASLTSLTSESPSPETPVDRLWNFLVPETLTHRSAAIALPRYARPSFDCLNKHPTSALLLLA